MNKNYYKKLKTKYFEATLSPWEERRFKSFLSRTDDPEFNDAKAVAGFFAAGKADAGGLVIRRIWPVIAAAASAAAIILLTIHVGQLRRNSSIEAICSMENTLADIFSSGTDVETELLELLNQ